MALRPHELLQVRAEEVPVSAELLSKLPFGSHPKTFGVLGVHIGVEWVNKVLLMHDTAMWVDAAIQLRNVLIGRPAV